MTEIMTKPTDLSVNNFLEGIGNEKKKADAYKILNLMQEITGEPPKMWGSSIIGFGNYHYRYPTGREGDWFLTGFSPRKQNFAFYLISGFDQFSDQLEQLGKHKTSVSCLYINKLADVKQDILAELIALSIQKLKSRGYGC